VCVIFAVASLIRGTARDVKKAIRDEKGKSDGEINKEIRNRLLKIKE